MLTVMQPVDRGGGKLVLEFGSTFFEVTAGHGARVTSLRCGGRELLSITGSVSNPDMYGSTFWPSPQKWPWPPPPEIDNLAYAATVDAAGAITATGQPHAGTSLTVTKKFSANLAREAIEVEYLMKNSGLSAVSWAPWEITRVPATGVAFWPTGGTPFGPKPLVTEASAGHTWCDPSKTVGEAKIFADGGGGYLAYAASDLLLIKQFAPIEVAVTAPGEAEVEIYVNPEHSYVEVEQQGPFGAIAPGATVPWKVTWYARTLPAGVAVTVGNADLIAFVAQTLQ